MEIETGMVDKKVPTASKSKPWEQSGENRGTKTRTHNKTQAGTDIEDAMRAFKACQSRIGSKTLNPGLKESSSTASGGYVSYCGTPSNRGFFLPGITQVEESLFTEGSLL